MFFSYNDDEVSAMSECAIMQPTYFPWAGYINLINQVDVFIFLDDVQFERGTWQNRNRILLNGQPHWLTVPASRQYLGQAINQIEIDDKKNWRQKHFKMLSNTYVKHPYVDQMMEVVREILDLEIKYLSELNIKIILDLLKKLGATTKILRSSELGIDGDRTDRLIKICEYLQCDQYISPVGSAQYLADDGFEEKTSIRLSFNNFSPGPYSQANTKDFVSHLSILDIIANLGWEGTRKYIGIYE